jgi:hypothetical protein
MELFSLKNLQGGTFAFEHLYLQISDSHIPYEFFLGLISPKEYKLGQQMVQETSFLLFRCQTTNSPIRA